MPAEKNMDFVQGMKDKLGMDQKHAEALIAKLDSDDLTALADALANDDEASMEQIVASTGTDEEVNPLFRGDNIDNNTRKKKHRRKVAPDYQYKFGDDVDVRMIDPETGNTHWLNGTVSLPNGPDHTIGVDIKGTRKMVDRKRVRVLRENALDEGVLGMINVPSLERMQQLAGIAPAQSNEVTVPDQSADDGDIDSCTAAQQAMEALDALAAVLPNVRLADLKIVRQRIVSLQTAMNESVGPD